jgi:hypothetical protein
MASAVPCSGTSCSPPANKENKLVLILITITKKKVILVEMLGFEPDIL